MKEWIKVVQRMIDWIEEHAEQNRMLEALSAEIGYSPWYCSVLFHDVTGMTIKSYASGRRLARAAEEIRDTKERILDIAVKYGYSSQEALSRLFKEQYGCTPAAYRRTPVPIRLQIPKDVLFPDYSEQERINTMEQARLFVRVEHIPAHKYLGVFEKRAANYCEFWDYQDCDTVTGIVTSMETMAHPIVTAHTAGWEKDGEKRTYFYGTGVPLDYAGPIPEGFALREIPAGDYLVFGYPSFDFMTENADVMGAVENMAWNFDPSVMGYDWNEKECPDYQRHYPEKFGYQVLRPVKKSTK
ncbi:MAG: helix-turn-helix transcriptional regulator [Lachnospiraceae bacterium]|nr:helix-turn-helix transcriptional regulator [Lachnospiraceae bacterium]